MSSEIIGLIAGALTTSAAIPQIIKSFKIKEVRDISFMTYLLIVIGTVLWLVYGISTKSFAVIFWNTVSTVLNSTILAQKIYYNKKSNKI